MHCAVVFQFKRLSRLEGKEKEDVQQYYAKVLSLFNSFILCQENEKWVQLFVG